MEKSICKNLTRVSWCCITPRIVRLMKILWTHLCDGKGLQLFLAQESICTSLRYSREEKKQEVTYWCRPVMAWRAVSNCAVAFQPPQKTPESPLGGGWRQEPKQCSLTSSFPRTVASQQKYAFWPDSSQSWGNRGRCERMRLWRSSLGKAAPRSTSAPSGGTWTRGRWHQWLYQTSVFLVKPMPSAHKNCFSRTAYPFHNGENSPFQQYSNSKETRAAIFHVNQGQKGRQFSSCYEWRVCSVPALLLTTTA